MSPSDDSTYQSGSSKKATFTLIAVKVLELCLLICCIGLIDEPAAHSTRRIFITPRVVEICYVTYGALLIYTAIHLIMTMLGDIAPWRTSTFWAIVGFILFIACTAVLFRDWSNSKDINNWQPNIHRLDLVLAAASVSLVTCIIYLVDILVTIYFGTHGELE